MERLSRGVVLKRKLPKRFGEGGIYVSPDAALKYWRRDLERVDPGLLEAAAELVKPGNRVWDVGANLGLFSFASAGLAGKTGRVLIIEPDAWLTTLLHRSAACRRDTSAEVEVLSLAVSDKVQLAHLRIAQRGRASNSLGMGRSQTGGTRTTQSALCVTLDWLLEVFDPPDVLKIDVEGHEAEVLDGARKILETAQPRILCEVGSENAAAVTKLLKNYGYSLFDADVPKSDRRELDTASWNTIAYPHKHSQEQ